MLNYIARRIGIGLLMLVALSILVFVLLRLAPGDAIADHKERGAGIMLIEEFEDFWCILRIRTVIDRQPDLILFRFEMSDNRAEPLT